MSDYEGGTDLYEAVEEFFEEGTDGGEFPSDDGSAYDCGGIIEQLDESGTDVWDGGCGGEIPTVWVDENGNEIPAPEDFDPNAGTEDWTNGLSMGLGPEDGENGWGIN